MSETFMVVTVKFVVVWVVTRFNRGDGGSIFLSNAGIRLKSTRRHNTEHCSINNTVSIPVQRVSTTTLIKETSDENTF
jgi:hypothetical protein